MDLLVHNDFIDRLNNWRKKEFPSITYKFCNELELITDYCQWVGEKLDQISAFEPLWWSRYGK